MWKTIDFLFHFNILINEIIIAKSLLNFKLVKSIKKPFSDFLTNETFQVTSVVSFYKLKRDSPISSHIKSIYNRENSRLIQQVTSLQHKII